MNHATRADRPARATPARERLLLPIALLVLVALSAFTVFSYRSGIERLVAARQDEALRLATRVALDARRAEPEGDVALLERAPGANRIVLVDSTGGVSTVAGEPLVTAPLAPLGGELPDEATVVGPGGAVGPLVTAFAPVNGGAVRVDLAAVTLDAQRRTAKVLTWVVVGVGAGLVVWLLLFVRQLLAPYQTLLTRVRDLTPGATDRDDVTALLDTVERALRRLDDQESSELEVLERTLGPSLDTGFLLLDRHGRVLSVNQTAAELLAIAPPRPGTPIGSLLGRRPTVRRVVDRVLERDEAESRHEVEFEVGDERRTLGMSVTPLRRDAHGDSIGFLVLFSELDEAGKGPRARLGETLTELGELAAGVAHELRNSLGTVSGYLTLAERADSEAERREHLEALRLETRRIERVVDDFLTFARPGTARVERVDLGALVERVSRDPGLREAEVEIRTVQTAFEPADAGAVSVPPDDEPPPSSGPVGAGATMEGDPELLSRALRNLVRNAVEATAAGGVDPSRRDDSRAPVEIVHGWSERGYEIVVRDRGPGVPAALRGTLFHPFVTGRSDGVGLGLSLAHRIVTLHGGELSIEERDGGGTCARMTFPAAEEG